MSLIEPKNVKNSRESFRKSHSSFFSVSDDDVIGNQS